MIPLVVLMLVAQPVPCRAEAVSLVREAAVRMEVFDTRGAVGLLTRAAGMECSEADVAATYLAGLIAAREAYRFGGDPDSLAPVVAAQQRLQEQAVRGDSRAEIARVVLLAAAAAAQSERGDMTIFLEHAVHLESAEIALHASGAPFLTAHEVAGDLWLQVHRYEDAEAAYRAAMEAVGHTPRVLIGLARVAVRLGHTAAACDAYRDLVSWWMGRPTTPDEVVEAGAFVKSGACPAQPRAR